MRLQMLKRSKQVHGCSADRQLEGGSWAFSVTACRLLLQHAYSHHLIEQVRDAVDRRFSNVKLSGVTIMNSED